MRESVRYILGLTPAKGVPAPPAGFLIIANDDGSIRVDDAGLIYIVEEAA